MVNLDKALAMLLDEAAKLDRRSAAQWLTVAIEDVLLNMPDDKFQMLWQRVESKIEATADETDERFSKTKPMTSLPGLRTGSDAPR